MKKKIIVILLILLFISGCQYFGRKETAADIYTIYHQGNKGLELRFVPGAPPPIVYDQPDFPADRNEISVLVEVRNRGAFDMGTTISNRPYGFGYLLLHGYDETIIRNLKPYGLSAMYPKSGIIFLNELDCFGDGIEGKSRYNAEGGYSVIEFPPKPVVGCNFPYYSQIRLPGGVDYYKPNLVATACYEYMTEASPQVCIDPDPYSERTDKACRVGGISSAVGKGAKAYVAAIEGISGGQGAPLTITNIEEEAMPGRSQFKIYIQNKGGGEVLSLDAIYNQKCGFPSELTYRDFDYFSYVVRMNDPNEDYTDPWWPWVRFPLIKFTVPGKPLKCEPDPPVRLDSSGRAIIYCNTAGFNFGGRSAYKTPLNIRLSYGYMSSVTMPIEIRSST